MRRKEETNGITKHKVDIRASEFVPQKNIQLQNI